MQLPVAAGRYHALGIAQIAQGSEKEALVKGVVTTEFF